MCRTLNEKELNLKVKQEGFIIEVVKTKCNDCKKFNFVTPVEIKNALSRRKLK